MARWSIISYSLKKRVVHCVIDNHTIKKCYTFNKLYITILPRQTFATLTSIVRMLMFCNFDPSNLLQIQLDSLWPLLWLHFNLLQLWLWLQPNLLSFRLQLQFDFLQLQCNYIQLLQLQLCFIFKMAFQSIITTLPKLLWILKIKVCVLFFQNWRYKLHTL
jgi:hypothetical protein